MTRRRATPPDAAAVPEDADASQTVKAQLRLRALIVGGELSPDERLSELTLVQRLRVSRTPVRAALQHLLEEGLLQALPGGGYVVKVFGQADIHDAIEVRGTLEGLAARLAAERGVAPSLLAELQDCLAQIDGLLAAPSFNDKSFGQYVKLNGQFHQDLAQACASATVERQIQRAAALPFASPNSFVMVQASGAQARDTLVVAQQQHHAVVQAIMQREGARAEALMREHARLAQHNLRAAMSSRQALARVPGAALIRQARLR